MKESAGEIKTEEVKNIVKKVVTVLQPSASFQTDSSVPPSIPTNQLTVTNEKSSDVVTPASATGAKRPWKSHLARYKLTYG